MAEEEEEAVLSGIADVEFECLCFEIGFEVAGVALAAGDEIVVVEAFADPPGGVMLPGESFLDDPVGEDGKGIKVGL